ncbi:MAG TPA: YbhB/YbcL family Raf kinase inhibitor-like protein [Holophagaceae bacterium]|nr:YbhB/YbcL family Raf kinase inhibitor-like protein [Holophagaceae bacterium]
MGALSKITDGLRPCAAVLILMAATACGSRVPKSELKLHIAAFAEGARIPAALTGDGEDRSPALAWSGAPTGTQAFAVVMDDPDAPGGTWVHWVLYDLPADAAKLDERLPSAPLVPGGGKQGRNSWGRVGWNGPSPPPGRAHRYIFHLYALGQPTGLPPGEDRTALDRAIKGHVLGEARWMGTYGR